MLYETLKLSKSKWFFFFNKIEAQFLLEQKVISLLGFLKK